MDSGRQTFWSIRQTLKRKTDHNEFKQILDLDAVYSQPQQLENAVIEEPHTSTENTTKSEQENDIDTILSEKVREIENTGLDVSSGNKINEWIETNSNNNITPVENDIIHPSESEDKTLNDLLEQVAELDEIYSDHVLRRDTYDKALLNELNDIDNCLPDLTSNNNMNQSPMDVDEHFDDAATYSSLQIAFKNPLEIPIDDFKPFDQSQLQIKKTNTGAPPRPAPPSNVTSPYMHVTAAEEEKLPPLPPKRLRKQDSNAENRASDANIADSNESQVRNQNPPIIIMKSPNHSSPSKKLNNKPGNSSTLPKQKKPGFFSKLFSRRKSKSDLSQASETNLPSDFKSETPCSSREPSVGNFKVNDNHRSSFKSLQPISLPTSPSKKVSKPVGRSVSSVSGKRPNSHLNADVIHIPLKGDSVNSLPHHEAYSNASTITLGNTLDRKTVSALQLADIPISDGNMELVAIADRQSLRNLCEGEFNVLLDPNVDLTEAEHFALYTSIPPQATASEFDETSAYYAPVDAGEILTPDEIAKRLTAASRHN